MRYLSFIAVTLLAPAAAFATGFQLQLPVDCDMGKDCVVQNFVDHDSQKGDEAYVDFMCERRSYDGHKGTDIRAKTRAIMLQGIPVVAAASGTVKGVRDGVEDDTPFTPGKECGNGVVIAHKLGWETQYCHLRQGSIVVSDGDEVEAGDKLGLMGTSGNTAFPHLHLSVRQYGNVIDPYVGVVDYTCGDEKRFSLWDATAKTQMAYQRSGILAVGFANEAPTMDAVQEGRHQLSQIGPDDEAMIFWVQLYGLHKSDVLALMLMAPNGQVVAQNQQFIDHSKAQYFMYLGIKRPASGWPSGLYTGHLKLLEPVEDSSGDVKIVLEKSVDIKAVGRGN